MRKFTLLLTSLVLVFFGACDIKKSDLEPEASFVRVYESTNKDDAYYPKDIVQLDDGNYFILAALQDSLQSAQMNFAIVCIIAVNGKGEVIDQETLPSTYSNPIPGWIMRNGQPSFVCMDDITNQAKIIEVEVDGDAIRYTEAGSLDKDFPLYAWSDGQDIVLLSYDSWGATVVTKYNAGLSSQWSSSFDIAVDPRAKVMEHLLLNKQKPFFIREILNSEGNTDFMVNCFEGSSLSLKFFNGSDGYYTAAAGIYSFQEETGLSAALHHTGNTISLARFHSGNSYVYPNAEIDRNALLSTKDFTGDILIAQLRAESPMDLILYEHHGEKFIVYASTTKSNQILLLFFNQATGIQEYSHTLGFGNPVEVTNIRTTSDEGLMVMGKTWINGQYQRIILYKIDKEQLLFEEQD